MTAGPSNHPPLAAADAPLSDPESIAPREWLLGARLERGCISLLAAPGGAGASALALAMAASLASGRDLLDETVHHSVPAWVLSLEDPADEVNRRLAALMQHHRIDKQELHGRLFLGDGWRLAMASARFGGIQHPDRNAILCGALARQVGLIVVDPFIMLRKLDGTSAMHMDLAAAAWTRVAEAARCAVLLVHPVRKAWPWEDTSAMEAACSARSLADAASSAGLLSGMRAEEAERLGVPAGERCAYARLDDAKWGLAPPAAQARWFRMQRVALGNGTELYPLGDQVGVITAWTPASLWAGHSIRLLNQVLDKLAEGPRPGQLYGPTRRGRAAGTWAGWVVGDMLHVTAAQAAMMIEAWLDSRLLVPARWRDRGHSRAGLAVDGSRRPREPALAPAAPAQAKHVQPEKDSSA